MSFILEPIHLLVAIVSGWVHRQQQEAIDDELATLERDLVDEAEVAAALADFDGVWECLSPREQAHVIELLVERISFDGQRGNVAITFRATGIKTLVGELTNRKEEAA